MQTQPILTPPRIIEYSEKQLEFQQHCYEDPYKDHRWNGKIGATRCGKTTLDFMWTIPFRITARKHLKGACCITGVSLGTIERNVLEPMRNYWTSLGYPNVIGETKQDKAHNTYVMIFGQKVYIIGMEKINAVKKLRGAEFKYVYCDELAECNEEAFILLKSRLSLPYSCCDFTCNPESDTHWLYFFINSNIDIYIQQYTIFDNPFLSPKFIKDLCDEYAGTVYYDRYILGRWKKAEGIIYVKFANDTQSYILHDIPKLMKINVGVDFGGHVTEDGHGSYHTFVATGFGYGYSYVVHLESRRIIPTDSYQLEREYIDFIKMLKEKYIKMLPEGNRCFVTYCDSAEPVLYRTMQNAIVKNHLPAQIKPARKMEIKQRIELQTRLFGQNRLYFMFTASTVIAAYSTAVWNSKDGHQDERLDDGFSTDIDTMDASEYSMEYEYKNLINTIDSNVRKGLVYASA